MGAGVHIAQRTRDESSWILSHCRPKFRHGSPIFVRLGGDYCPDCRHKCGSFGLMFLPARAANILMLGRGALW